MAIEMITDSSVPTDADVVGVLFGKDATPVDDAFGLDIEWLKSRGFEGSAGQTSVANVDGKTIVAIGLGDLSEAGVDGFRRSAAVLARAASKGTHAAFVVAGADGLEAAKVSQAVAEGAILGAYKFNAFKSKSDTPTLAKFTVVNGDSGGVEFGQEVAHAVSLARDLVNSPAAAATPTRLAEVATDVATANGLQIEVWDEEALQRERMGGLLGVSAGSDEPARMIRLVHEPADDYDQAIALVGKGITFDSGGLSLKPADGMMTMKTDMSGAAAVIAAMGVIPQVAPRTKVVAIVCATENLPGPKATKPGDVSVARNGKTMEVLNTDAEGRLVLADGLSLAAETDVDAIVDLATLTGACIVALGGDIAGLMGNHDGFRGQVQQAADTAGEPVWPLPLPKQYRKHIDSDIADIKNIGAGKGAAGSLTAGLFLQEFVSDKPWAHLDIAGPARADGDDGAITKGGTGFGVRTLVELVANFQKP